MFSVKKFDKKDDQISFIAVKGTMLYSELRTAFADTDIFVNGLPGDKYFLLENNTQQVFKDGRVHLMLFKSIEVVSIKDYLGVKVTAVAC